VADDGVEHLVGRCGADERGILVCVLDPRSDVGVERLRLRATAELLVGQLAKATLDPTRALPDRAVRADLTLGCEELSFAVKVVVKPNHEAESGRRRAMAAAVSDCQEGRPVASPE
jgi:hypothetical protein